MAKAINCSDLGMECGFSATAETAEELLGKVAEHANSVHGIEEIGPELAAQAQNAIRDI